MPWNCMRGRQSIPPMECKVRIKTVVLLFASLGTGIFLGVLGCFNYGTTLTQNGATFRCPPARESPFKREEEGEAAAMAEEKASLQHGLSDEELLWEASLIHRRPSRRKRRLPKVAFMFLTRGPLPLAPLWECFFASYDPALFSIYVHADPSFVSDAAPSSVFYLRNIPSQPAQWGESSICDAERRLLANALRDDPANERFILLSESCIPLYNLSSIYSAFTSVPFSYVQAVDDPSMYGRGRYSPRMQPEVSLSQWRKGSQWWEVTRELAVEIVADTKYYRKFRHVCQPHCYVDEHYIQTMLSIEHGSRLLNRTITHTDWESGGAHPTLFHHDSISTAFLTHIRGYYFFSRKYAPSALEPLLKLAPQVMFIPTGH